VFVVWLLKTSYEKRRVAILSASEVEMVCVYNFNILNNYTHLIDTWIKTLSEKRPYIASYGSFKLIDKPILVLGKDFINNFLPVSLMLENLEDDIKFFYKQYSDTVTNFIQNSSKNKEWEEFCDNTLIMVNDYKKSIEEINSDLTKVIGHVRLIAKQKTTSPFYLLDILHKNIYPKITEKKIKTGEEQIKKELENKKKETTKSQTVKP